MTEALLFTAFIMGLTGGPHCVAMCGPACAALGGRGRGFAAFQAGRIAGYAVLGGVAAGSLQAVGWLGALAPALRPLWTLVHLATLLLGLTLLLRARQPAWLEQAGRRAWARVAAWRAQRPAQAPIRWLAAPLAHQTPGGVSGAHAALQHQTPAPEAKGGTRPARAAMAGLLWGFMPCGLLYSALLVAVLAGSAAGGALVMASFAAASALSMGFGGWLWRTGRRHLGSEAGTRLAGAVLTLVSIWALWLGATQGRLPWCAT